MKKIAVVLLSLFVLTGLVAQNYEVYNQLGSDIVELKPVANAEVHFAGLYDEVYGKVSASMFTAEARYRLNLLPNNDKWDSARLANSNLRANVWFRPASAVELVMGNDYYQAIAGSFMVVYDDYTKVGRFGKNGFGATFTPLKSLMLGFNIPEGNYLEFKDNFTMKVNFGINYAYENIFNVGASFLGTIGGTQSVGLFGNYIGTKGLYIGLGYVYDGESIARTNINKYYNLYSTVSDHLIDFTISYQFPAFRFGGDFEIGFQNEDTYNDKTPLYTGLMAEFGITKDVLFNVKGTLNCSNISDNDYNRTYFTVYPKIVYTSAKNGEFSVGFDFISVEDGENTYHLGYTFPVYWKYYFK